MVRAYLGLGGNLGDRIATLAGALRVIDSLPATAVIGVSRVYESEPWPDADQPPYANAVAAIETALEADVLLGRLKGIEREFGREETERNAPRPLDLDIVLYGDEEWESDALTIPHPRFAEREFVVVPLLEVDPFAELPDGTRVRTTGATHGRITGLLGTLPGFEDVTRSVPGPVSGAADQGSLTGGAGDAGMDDGEGAVAMRDTDSAHVHTDEEWVVVVESVTQARMPGTPDAGLIFKRTVLECEGIPFAWDPYAPEDASNPYGLEPVFRLRVPASLEERARRALAEAEAAPLDLGEGGDLRSE